MHLLILVIVNFNIYQYIIKIKICYNEQLYFY